MHIADRSLTKNFSSQILAENPKQFAVSAFRIYGYVSVHLGVQICQQMYVQTSYNTTMFRRVYRVYLNVTAVTSRKSQSCMNLFQKGGAQQFWQRQIPLIKIRQSAVTALVWNIPARDTLQKKKKTGKYGKFSQNVSRHASQE